MKTCPNCGSNVPATAKFCPKCGFKFQPVPSSATGATQSESNAPVVAATSQTTQPVIRSTQSTQPVASVTESATPVPVTKPTPRPIVVPQPVAKQAAPVQQQTQPQANAQQKQQAQPRPAVKAQERVEPTVQPQNTQPQPNQTHPQMAQGIPNHKPMPTPAPAATGGLNYFQWLMNGLKHPSHIYVKANKYFGLITLLLVAIVNSVTVAIIGNQYSSAALSAANKNNYGQYDTTSAQNSVSQTITGITLRLIILLVVINLVIFTTAFCVRKYSAHSRVNYLTMMTAYSQQLASVLAVGLLGLLLSFMGGDKMNIAAGVLILIGYTMQMVAMFHTSLAETPVASLDNYFVLVIADLLMLLVIGFLIRFFGDSVKSLVINLLQGALAQYFSN